MTIAVLAGRPIRAIVTNLVALDMVLLEVALAEVQTNIKLHNVHTLESLRQQLCQLGPIVKAPSTNLPTSFDDYCQVAITGAQQTVMVGYLEEAQTWAKTGSSSSMSFVSTSQQG